jgi:hypothetical protein
MAALLYVLTGTRWVAVTAEEEPGAIPAALIVLDAEWQRRPEQARRGATMVEVLSRKPAWPRTLLRVCVLYTGVTVTASVHALANGQATDAHVHLLLRFAFVVVGIGGFDLFDTLRLRYPGARDWLVGITAYAAAVTVTLSGMWLWGALGGELHPGAFRDGLLSLSGVGLVVAAILALRARLAGRWRGRMVGYTDRAVRRSALRSRAGWPSAPTTTARARRGA